MSTDLISLVAAIFSLDRDVSMKIGGIGLDSVFCTP